MQMQSSSLNVNGPLELTRDTMAVFLDFPIREVHCDASAETDWEILARNVQWLQAYIY